MIFHRLSLYVKLTRLDRPIGSLLLLWPSYWALWLAAGGMPPLKELLIFTVGTVFMRSAGCAVNDAADAEFDRHVARTAQRVVTAGDVSRREAVVVGVLLAAAAGALLFALNSAVWPWAFAALAVAFCYPFFKRFFPIPQLVLGVAFSMGIPLAYAAILGYVPIQAAWVFAANFCWIVAYDTAYAMADKPDDLRIGIKTSAVFFGRFDAHAVFVFHALFICIWTMVLMHSNVRNPVLAYLGLFAAIGLIARQLKPVFSRDRAACLKAFLDNNWVGVAVWLGLVSSLI